MVTKRKKTHAIDCDLGVDCTCTPTLAQPALENLLKLCRRYGVLSFKQGGLEFALAPMLATDPDVVAPSSLPVPASQPETGVKREPKRGADGLTAEQQEELFMRPMDAQG